VQPLFEHRLTLAGYETRALELEGKGPPLLLLHGWADSADTWRLLLDRLGRQERRALAVDLPGFGTAAELDDGPVLEQLDDFVDDALTYSSPGGRPLVVGNSLGGCLALRAAARRELRLQGAVAVAPAGLEMARWFTLVRRDPLLRALLASPVPVPGPIVRGVVGEAYRRLAFRRPGDVDPLIVSTFSGHLGSKEAAGRVLATARRLLPELSDPFRLELIDCPVLLVWGRHDVMVFQTGAERVVEAVPGARLEVIEDCGHCPQLEAPDHFADLLLRFPRSLARAA
jgi:pimeloyl-ACP methyl ester carboxylesterase